MLACSPAIIIVDAFGLGRREEESGPIMYHGLSNQVLYSAARITVTFDVEGGEQKSKTGTCFILRVGKPYLVTNRHCVDLFYKKAERAEFSIRVI